MSPADAAGLRLDESRSGTGETGEPVQGSAENDDWSAWSTEWMKEKKPGLWFLRGGIWPPLLAGDLFAFALAYLVTTPASIHNFLLPVVAVCMFLALGLYRSNLRLSVVRDLPKIVVAAAVGFGAEVVVPVFHARAFISSDQLIDQALVFVILLTAVRSFQYLVVRRARKRGLVDQVRSLEPAQAGPRLGSASITGVLRRVALVRGVRGLRSRSAVVGASGAVALSPATGRAWPEWNLDAAREVTADPAKKKPRGEYIPRRSAVSVVFLDPSGRRWRKLRVFAAAVTALVVLGLVLVFPKLVDTPALNAFGEPLGPSLTSADTGTKVPLVGTGPLLQVLRVSRDAGGVRGIDPFTNVVKATFTPAEVKQIGSSDYAIHKFGYSAGAKKTISLTFDDGPDPRWTPELLNLLAAEKVPATFFATGTMIAKHPDIFEREVREGHAVANHSLTHTDLTSAPTWRARLELTVTDHVIRAVTGKEVGYFRLPYEGNDEESTQATIDGLLRSQRYGYLVTSHDFDTDDWAYAAKEETGEIPLPELNGDNVTLLMHDGGGNGRQLTVDYVRKLIPYAKAHGYTFQTMPQVQPWLQDRVVDVQPTLWDKVTLSLVRDAVVWPNTLLRFLFVGAVTSVVLLGGVNVGLAIVRRRRRERKWAWRAAQAESLRRQGLPPEPASFGVSVVVAAFNEETVIARTLESVLASSYPFTELIVVNDGSTDATADEVTQIANRDPRIVLVNQDNTGKADALNHGLHLARGEVIVTLDADTILEANTIQNLVRHFEEDETGNLGAVAGVLRVGNRDRNLLTRWQALEYLTQIGIERAAQDAMGAISIVPGACAAWRKTAILEVGGYTHATLAEDCDLTLSLHRAGWQITQDDYAAAFTEAPETVDALLAQRTRWVYGTLQAIYKHRDMMFKRRFRWLGWYVLPNYTLSILVPLLLLPFMVFMGIDTIQHGGLWVLLAFFAGFLTVHLAMAAIGIRLMREKWHHLLMVPIYRLIFEPLRAYLLYTSVYMAVRGVRAGWNKLARTGSMDSDLGKTYQVAPTTTDKSHQVREKVSA